MIIHDRRFSEVMEAYHVRTFAKPGNTGLAQMSEYRGETKNFQYDVSGVQAAKDGVLELPPNFSHRLRRIC
jgi:hypothetical protein